ncbi:MAG TPA: glycosyltransferase family 1 protein [Calditrichaeota bacterium]|nr:glycosyltransferase family 1 protein [Calditrichota bacterium]
MNFAFLTSYPLDVRIGSGVIRTLVGWQLGLQKLKQHSTLIVSQIKATTLLSLTNQRLQFNRCITKMDFGLYDYFIGSDFDGYRLDVGKLPPYFVFNGALLADIARFEEGRTAKILKHLARREQQNMQKAIAVFVPSLFSADKVSSLYHIPENKIHLIPLGNDYTEWQQLLSQAGIMTNSKKIILSVARQYPRKGIADLLKAFTLIRKKSDLYLLWIVGGGPQLEANRRLAEKLGIASSVRFYGDVTDRQNLARLYKNSDLFCLPSYHETFGLVFLEAMASGLPIVAYRTTAVPEVVSEDTGILVTAAAIHQLAEALQFLLDNPSQSQKLAATGKIKAEKMTWQASANQLIYTLLNKI